MKSYTSKGDLAARAVLNKLDFDGNKARTAFFLLKIGDGPPLPHHLYHRLSIVQLTNSKLKLKLNLCTVNT